MLRGVPLGAGRGIGWLAALAAALVATALGVALGGVVASGCLSEGLRLLLFLQSDAQLTLLHRDSLRLLLRHSWSLQLGLIFPRSQACG